MEQTVEVKIEGEIDDFVRYTLDAFPFPEGKKSIIEIYRTGSWSHFSDSHIEIRIVPEGAGLKDKLSRMLGGRPLMRISEEGEGNLKIATYPQTQKEQRYLEETIASLNPPKSI